MKNLVSICIPAYKQPLLLKKAIESVLMQSYTNYEIIVSDDTPGDSVKKAIEFFNNSKIIYHKNEKALGSPANWNKAISLAKGDYIKVLHHDDHFCDKKGLQKFVSAIDSDPSVKFVFCYTDIYFKQQNEHYLHTQTVTQLKRMRAQPEFLFFRNCIGAPSVVMFKNDPSVIFDESYKWLVDVEFYINYLKKHKNFSVIKEALVTVVDGSEEQVTREISNDKKLVIKENIDLFSKIYSEKLNTPNALLFFQELVVQFEINSFEELKQGFNIPANIELFLKEVFVDMKKNTILKKIKKRLLTSRYNKRIFKIERF